MRQKFTETEIRKMYEEEYIKKNLSMKKVGEKYNMSEGQVAYYFKKFNLKTKDLSAAHRKYTLDESYFEKIDREDKAYWLGFLYADGNVYIGEKNRKQYVITLSLKNTDREHVVEFRKAIQSKAKIKNSDHGMVTLAITSKKMAMDLIKLGCVPNKTFKITFPSEEIVPRYLQRHFIRGVFDGDGCISFIKGNDDARYHVDFQILGTEHLLNETKRILLREQAVFKEPKITKIKGIYKLRLTGVYNAIKIMSYLYDDATVFLQRKKDIFKKISNIKINNSHLKRKINNDEKICAVCGDSNCDKYLICHVPGEYYEKILCGRHYNQIKNYGMITNPKKYRKIKCVNNGMIFHTATEAAKWCGLSNSSVICLYLQGKYSYAGRDPVSGEKLQWEEYYE